MQTKKITLLAISCIIAQTSYGQSVLKAGTVALGGNINYVRNSAENPYGVVATNGVYLSTTQKTISQSLNITPSVGYFVADNVAVGVSAQLFWGQNDVSYSAYFSPSTATQKNSSYLIGPFVQYYKMLTEQFGVVGTLSGGYLHTSTGSFSSSTPTYSGDGLSVGLAPSIVYFPIPKLGISAAVGGLGYNYLKNKPENTTSAAAEITRSSLGANFGLSQLTFGGTYYFGR